MKKILNFSLCILLALSLSLGNVAPVVNAKRWDSVDLSNKTSEVIDVKHTLQEALESE